MHPIRITLLAGLAALSLTACGPRGDRFEQMARWRVDDALDEVNATDAQRKQAQVLTDNVIRDVKPLAALAKENGEALKVEWQKDVPDAAHVHAMVDTQLAAVQRFAHALADTSLEVHRMLTPEQRAQVTKRLAKHDQKHPK